MKIKSGIDVVKIESCRSYAGTKRPEIPDDGEGFIRKAKLRSFGITSTTITNDVFAAFVKETQHVTTAEQLGRSFVFRGLLPLSDAANPKGLPWWLDIKGASWQHPTGPESNIGDLGEHPVVHVSYEDAKHFAHWAGGRLPTEIEWEHAARGGEKEIRYPWGNKEPTDEKADFCNIWQGNFPYENSCRDGYYGTAPAKSFAPNSIGMYNMAGNVWEWCADPFKIQSLSRQAKMRNSEARKFNEKVLKGGSYLCHRSVCWRYRIAARSGRPADNTTSNCGFRLVFDL